MKEPGLSSFGGAFIINWASQWWHFWPREFAHSRFWWPLYLPVVTLCPSLYTSLLAGI